MDWPDDDFETYLRQFRPRRPKPLPTSRRTALVLAAAAVLVAAVVIPLAWGIPGLGTTDSRQTPGSTPSTESGTGIDERRGEKGRTAPSLDRVGSAPEQRRGGFLGSPREGSNSAGSPPSARSANGVNETNRRVRVGQPEDVKPPRKVVDVRAAYPDDAQAAGIEGIVVLEIVIGEDGSVLDAWVIRSIPELDQAAIDAVRQWQFEPTLLNGEPVEVEMEVTINFTLQ